MTWATEPARRRAYNTSPYWRWYRTEWARRKYAEAHGLAFVPTPAPPHAGRHVNTRPDKPRQLGTATFRQLAEVRREQDAAIAAVIERNPGLFERYLAAGGLQP